MCNFFFVSSPRRFHHSEHLTNTNNWFRFWRFGLNGKRQEAKLHRVFCFRLHNFTHLWRINKEQFKLSALRTKHNQISDILDSQNNNQHSSLELRIINAIDDHGQRTSLEPIFTPSEAKSKRPSTTCTMGMDFDILFYHVNNAVGDPKFFDSNSVKYRNATISLHISLCRN